MAEIVNWYDKIGANNNKKKLPSKWKSHHILHNSMILCIGGTGTGKTNSLIDYISRSSGEFYKIIICSFSTLDEPLYNFLAEKNGLESAQSSRGRRHKSRLKAHSLSPASGPASVASRSAPRGSSSRRQEAGPRGKRGATQEPQSTPAQDTEAVDRAPLLELPPSKPGPEARVHLLCPEGP